MDLPPHGYIFIGKYSIDILYNIYIYDLFETYITLGYKSDNVMSIQMSLVQPI